jgi:hypothetical protein
MDERWSAERAWAWYRKRPRPLGCNFIPSTAGNQLEMWGADGFDRDTIARDTIARELDWAAGLGMNALRVFLHDQAYEAEPEGFLQRLDEFLGLAAARGLSVMPVLFDDCWHEPGSLGPNPEPRPGVHNSIWLRSPGLAAARDRGRWPRLEAYVKATVSAFGRDSRVLAWDVYNEVGNFFLPALSRRPPLRQALLLVKGLAFYLRPSPTLPLLRAAFAWCRAMKPEQPLTSPIYFNHANLNRELIELSDVVSFHNYRPSDELREQATALAAYGRPLLCTEYLARTTGSRFASCLPVFEELDIGYFNWGLVSGRTQTIYTWDDAPVASVRARVGRAAPEPVLWYHDVLRPDGTPYDPAEAAALRQASARLTHAERA